MVPLQRDAHAHPPGCTRGAWRSRRQGLGSLTPSMNPLSNTETLASGRHTSSKSPGEGRNRGVEKGGRGEKQAGGAEEGILMRPGTPVWPPPPCCLCCATPPVTPSRMPMSTLSFRESASYACVPPLGRCTALLPRGPPACAAAAPSRHSPTLGPLAAAVPPTPAPFATALPSAWPSSPSPSGSGTLGARSGRSARRRSSAYSGRHSSSSGLRWSGSGRGGRAAGDSPL